jgi:flagellar protein FlaG
MSDDGMTVKPPAGLPVPVPSERPQPRQAATPDTAESHATKQQATGKTIEAVAQQLETFLKRVNRSLEFHVDQASGRMVCSVRDAQTGDLIRQIPNEEVLRLAELAHDETIVLVNERV